MIDIENYKRAIEWLRRSQSLLVQQPNDELVRLGIVHTFQVSHNITEAILREAYVALGVDELASFVSIRELIRRAAEEGLVLSTSRKWLEYGLILESIQEDWMQSAKVDLTLLVPILPQFTGELDAFAQSLQKRMATLA